MAYRGNNRKPSSAVRRTIARVVIAGVAVGAPLALSSSFASADPNWDAIAACESGGNWSKNAPVRTAPVQPALVASNPAGDYTVVAGDTLSKIAKAANVPGGWQALFEKNKQFIGDPNLIVP